MYKIEIEIKGGRYVHTIATNAKGETLQTNDINDVIKHIIAPNTGDESEAAEHAAQKAVCYDSNNWCLIGDTEEDRIFCTSKAIEPLQNDKPIVNSIERIMCGVDAAAAAVEDLRSRILPDGVYGLPEPAKKAVRR